MEFREISSIGSWTVSSFKQGHGLEQLLDTSTNTFWQSDGPQPHYINIQFKQKISIQRISLFLDFATDESYTPKQISIRAGNTLNDMHQVKLLELVEPVGWVDVDMIENNHHLRTCIVQLTILSNHENGKDTHLRRIKLYSPIASIGLLEPDMLPFNTLEYEM